MSFSDGDSRVCSANGVVLLSSSHKEYDSRIEILTSEYGRITCFVKGSRRPHNPLSAATIPFTFANFILYESPRSYTLKSAHIIKHFSELSDSMDDMIYASYFGELVRYYSRENITAENEVNLLYLSIHALIQKLIPAGLIRIIFEMRLLYIQGEGMNPNSCISCGKEGHFPFYLRKGGMLCNSCLQKVHVNERPITLSADALYALRYIASSPLKNLFAFNLKDEVIKELREFVDAYFDIYVHKTFNSLELLI
jgi:DNA repair protein RecO (recombination protein O)